MKKILMIDDDKDLSIAIKAILESKNYVVDTASTRAEGMEKIKTNKPDLLILDVHMDTEHEGFEINKELRSSDKYVDMPILMLTGIDTMTVNHQIIDMYRYMREQTGMGKETVLKVKDINDYICIDYVTSDGETIWLPVDGFLSKPVDNKILFEKIEHLLSKKI